MKRAIWMICAATGVALSSPVQSYELSRATFSGGAVSTGGGRYQLGGTIGEAGIIGSLIGDTQILGLGFWGWGGPRVSSDIDGVQIDELPLANFLEGASPNPFRGETSLRYSIARTGPVLMSVYDLSGRRIQGLVAGDRDPGTYTVRWDGRDESGNEAANGLYFIRLESGSWSQTRKIVRLR